MSYYGSHEQAIADAKKADLQIDGHEASGTSPVRDGDGAAPILKMEGPKEFTTERHRHGWKGNQGGMRREYPTEGVSKK